MLMPILFYGQQINSRSDDRFRLMIQGDTAMMAMKFSMDQGVTWLLSDDDLNLVTNVSINRTTFDAT
jgi:hypothetical protein